MICIVDGKILLVRQERPAIGKETLEIPAGKLEYGENPMECGLRELNEETGMACDKLELLLSLYPLQAFAMKESGFIKRSIQKKQDIKLSI